MKLNPETIEAIKSIYKESASDTIIDFLTTNPEILSLEGYQKKEWVTPSEIPVNWKNIPWRIKSSLWVAVATGTTIVEGKYIIFLTHGHGFGSFMLDETECMPILPEPIKIPNA